FMYLGHEISEDIHDILSSELDKKVYTHVYMIQISPDCYILRQDYYAILDGKTFLYEGNDGKKLTDSKDNLISIKSKGTFVVDYKEGVAYPSQSKYYTFEEVSKILNEK